MKIAVVGVQREYSKLPEDYRDTFDRFHLELPFYFARHGGNDVTITTVDNARVRHPLGDGGGLRRVTESDFLSDKTHYDVVIHWRKWFPSLYRSEAINVVNCQDHSLSYGWISLVREAYEEKKLAGILCFPAWHKDELHRETLLPLDFFIDGLTLGVDTEIYRPSIDKDPYQLLWASDPGRGYSNTLQIFLRLFSIDRRFRLHVCWPDYVKGFDLVGVHPGIIKHGVLNNGQSLWDIFNSCGILPYASSFKEPSSRAHRQAQAAGSMVLYPQAMGTPSDLIESDRTGIVSAPSTWANTIVQKIESGDWKRIGAEARQMAVSENWEVQTTRFNRRFSDMIVERKR